MQPGLLPWVPPRGSGGSLSRGIGRPHLTLVSMNPGILLHRLLLGTGGALLLSTTPSARAGIIAAWETSGQASFGTQNLAATVAAPEVSVGGLTRGSGVSTAGAGSIADAWGGAGFDTGSIGDAVAAGDFITFTVTPGPGAEISFETFSLNYRRDGSGPVSAALQFQIGNGGFIDVEEPQLEADTTAGGAIIPIDLTGYGEIQGISGQTVTFRLVVFGGEDEFDKFWIYGPLAGYDLTLEGQITGGSGGDTSPPQITGLSPADNATALPAATTNLLTMTFNENVARGTGQILVKETLTGTPAYTLDVTDPAAVTLGTNQIGLVLPAGLLPGTDYHVEMPAGAIVDLASPANPHAGLTGSSAWNFSTAVVIPPPQVVVNKYVNGTPDRIELMVIGNGSPGSTVDLRGMILKDFGGDMNTDSGGRHVFTTNPAWAAVPAGTLITVSNVLNSPDTSADDFKLAAGLLDPALFTLAPGSPPLDLTATDMVMIKSAGSDPQGTAGGIHALAAGAAGTFFNSFTGAKLRAIATAGTNLGVRVANSSASQSDFMSGGDATGNQSLGLSDFGAPNSGTNASYLAALRGWAAGDGDGAATVVNGTLSSTFLGLPMFDRAQSGQSVRLTITPRIQGITLSNIRVVVPAELGTPATVNLSGPGAAGASQSIAGQAIVISSASATSSSPLEISIGGLSTPAPGLAANNGGYPLTVSTSANGGTLRPIASQAAVQVITPVSSVRELDSEGTSPDLGAVVAVEGIVTEADFGGGAANFSGFLEDGTAGINIFSSSLFLGLARNNRFAIVGTVSQINGQTAIVPASSSHIVNRLTVPDPTPTVVSLAALLADPEAYEGRLIKVTRLSLDSGTWGPGATVTLKNAAELPIEIRIQSGSTAVSPPPFPANVTGIFGQSDTASPYNSGYFLMPRDPADLEGSLDDFQDWILETGATGGAGGDPDFDGVDNAFEYAFGLNPNSGQSTSPITADLNRTSGKFLYTRRIPSKTTLNYRVFTSENLSGWTEDTGATSSVLSTVGNVETVEVTLSAAKPLAAPKLFFRVEAE